MHTVIFLLDLQKLACPVKKKRMFGHYFLFHMHLESIKCIDFFFLPSYTSQQIFTKWGASKFF